jgi:hypothetical protein
MFLAVRSLERPPSALMERPDEAANQRRVDDAFQLLAAVATRIVNDPSSSVFFLDLSSQDGALQAVWCRDGSSAFIPGPSDPEPQDMASGVFGPVNAERYVRAQKALSALLLELMRPGCDGSATLKIGGIGGELADEFRGQSHRQWRF